MQTAKEMRKKARFKIQEGDKVLLRQEKENSPHLQLFRRMVIVFLLRPMVYSTVEM